MLFISPQKFFSFSRYLSFCLDFLVIYQNGLIKKIRLFSDFMTSQPAIIFIIFRDFLMFYQIFLSPQMKRWAIITYKHGIYELPHELPNHLRLRILGN